MKKQKFIRESALTESDLSPGELFYPKQKRKEIAITRQSKVNETVWPDLLFGYLQPIVYKLNQGKNVEPNSLEHRALKQLLESANKK